MRTLIYFGIDKTLVEVELQYQQRDWDRPAYEDFFNGARKRLEARYGRATVLHQDPVWPQFLPEIPKFEVLLLVSMRTILQKQIDLIRKHFLLHELLHVSDQGIEAAL